MAAALLAAAWVAVGVGVAFADSPVGRLAPWERVLSVAFWPFFLAARLSGAEEPTPRPAPAAPAAAAGSLERLRAALSPDDPARATVGDLAAVLSRQAARVDRLDAALHAASAPPHGHAGAPPVADPLVVAQARSRALLRAARDRERVALAEGLAAVEDAATRLTLLRECGEDEDVGALLADLAARLGAAEELAGRERPEAG